MADRFRLVMGETRFAIMTAELTQEVSRRLGSDRYGWLTTVAKSGQPVPRLVWFFFDGNDLTVYSMPNAAKLAHISARPRVSLNLDSDGNGRNRSWWAVRRWSTRSTPIHSQTSNIRPSATITPSQGMSDEHLGAFTTRLKISVDKVWTVPSAE